MRIKSFLIMMITIAGIAVSSQSCKKYDVISPNNVPVTVNDFINDRYPGAKIIEIDNEYNKTQVEIIYKNTEIDVYFDSNENWLYSLRDVKKKDVPTVVLNTLENSQYSDWRIDDIDFIETPEQDYYKFELEKGGMEYTMKINAEGFII